MTLKEVTEKAARIQKTLDRALKRGDITEEGYILLRNDIKNWVNEELRKRSKR